MKRLGIKVTEEELSRVHTEQDLSGMWGIEGTHLGDPAREVGRLAKKYNLPVDTGLDMKTGEFVSK